MALIASVLALSAGSAEAKEPSTGVPYQPRQGWYTETQFGVFTAFGGYNAIGASKPASNAQPFLALSVGRDLTEIAGGLSAFLTVAHGYNAGACRQADSRGCATYKLEDGSPALAPENFSVLPIEIGARYRFGDFLPRLGAYATVVGGFTFLTPAVTEGAPIGSAHAGLGLGLEYNTRLPGLSIGAEVLGRFAFSPTLPSLSAYPRVKYTF